MISALRVVAKAIRLVWLTGIVALLALMTLPHLLPAIGHQMYIVLGGSMQPAIPIGGIVIVDAVDPADILAGQIVTFRAASGTVVTHRVLAVNDTGELSFTTKGDASAAPDPVIVPASAVIGRVAYELPWLGILLTSLGTFSGAVAALGVLGSLLLVGWFADELAATLRPASARRTAAEAAN